MKRYALKHISYILLLLMSVGCGNRPTPTPDPPTPTAPPPTHTALPVPTVTPLPDIPEPSRPLFMAHYMPWYQTPSGSGVWGWHWTMNHFSPSKMDEDGRREIASYVMPLTGPYDSSDEVLLEYQVLLMKLSGIDGVIVDWYGIEDFWDYAILNENTNKLFPIIKKAGLQFALCYEDQTIKHMVDNKHLPTADVYTHGQSVMQYAQDTWFGDDTYLKVVGRPVLLTFGPQYFGKASDWDTLFSVLDTRPAFITLDKHTESAGLSSFPWPPMWASTGGVLSQERLESYLTGFYNKAERWDYLVAGAFPGFKDIYQEAGIANETRYLDPQQGQTLRLTLRMALEQNPDVIQLITWNDYGETTSIEPTEEFGYQYLEIVQQTRRDVDDSFSFTADDLRLPLQVFNLRKRHKYDDEILTQLDEGVNAIWANDLDQARAILDEF